ncbi:MAG: GTP-binding protein [Rubrivivax sp.]|nr:GTP-binding protein [Rubrivivax sp.]
MAGARTRLIFIGRNLPREEFAAALAHCGVN